MPRTEVAVPDINAAIASGEKLPVKQMTAEQRGQLIEHLRTNLSGAVRQIDNLYLHVGMYWNFMVKNKLYKYWGSHIKNVNHLVRELNLGVGRSTLDHYARIYAMFGKYLRRENLCPPLSRLLVVHPVLENRQFENEDERDVEVTAWAHKAASLSIEDLRNEVREARGMVTTDECTHPPEQSQLWSRCGCCGKWIEMIPNIGETIRKEVKCVPVQTPLQTTPEPQRRYAEPQRRYAGDTQEEHEQRYNNQLYSELLQQSRPQSLYERAQRENYERAQHSYQRAQAQAQQRQFSHGQSSAYQFWTGSAAAGAATTFAPLTSASSSTAIINPPDEVPEP
jgi:hypothetical protein